MKSIEAVILTGGQSRRMGRDKAQLLVFGEPILDRMLRLIHEIGIETTVLGPQGKPDDDPGSGPLAALAGFRPSHNLAFICSCDLPLFDARLIDYLLLHIGENEAIIPSIAGRLQPLCALYRSSALERTHALVAAGEQRLFSWVDGLSYTSFDSDSLRDHGLNPMCAQGANTPEAWEQLLRSATSQMPD